MRSFLLMSLFSFLMASCASAPRAMLGSGGPELSTALLASKLVDADVIVLGEEHDSAGAHAAHQALIAELYILRQDLVISMEMFERDVQAAVTQYLRGDIGEEEFLARSRPWPNYKTDYRPVIEFAKARKLEVIAGNIPRDLANKASKNGAASVIGSPMAARATTAPEDAYWQDFQKAMGSHGGTGESKAMKLFYEAQCLKDDTMAESIADRVAQLRKDGRKPLVVHICGRFHSDRRLGTVARLEQRMQGAKIQVLSVIAPDKPVQTPPIADYLFRIEGVDREDDAPKATAKADPHKADPHKVDPHQPAAAAKADPHKLPAAAPNADPHQAGAPAGAPAQSGGRPALGVKPDYNFTGEGLMVEDLTPGGAAEAAGIKAGDLILKLGGEEVESVQGYMQVLQNLTPGQEIEVTLKRDGKETKLKVKVGTRAGG